MASLQTTLKQDHIFNRLAVASTPVMGLCLLVGCWAGHQRVDGEQGQSNTKWRCSELAKPLEKSQILAGATLWA